MTNPITGWDITIKGDVPYEAIISWAEKHWAEWKFQKEIGTQSGYVHYQFRGRLKLKVRASGIGKLLKQDGLEGHASPTSNEAFIAGDYGYVVKDDTRIEGPWSSEQELGYIPSHLRGTPEWNEMQQMIIGRMNEKPDMRTINCIVDHDGCNGKSFIALWMDAHGKAVYIPFFTEARDMMRIVHGSPRTTTYFIDIPRAMSHRAEHEIYGGIEQLKSGFIYEDRYRYRREHIELAHVFVFTNRIPNMTLCSADRWRVTVLPRKAPQYTVLPGGQPAV